MTNQRYSFDSRAGLAAFSSTLTLFVLLFMSVASTRGAHAATFPACTAEDIIASDIGCPASGLCTITETVTVTDGCVLDFGTRDVEIAASGELQIDMAEVTLRAGNFTVAPGGLVNGRTATIGGSFLVEATGNIAVERVSSPTVRNGVIRVSGSVQGGSILLDAAGDITIDGQLTAHNRFDPDGAGGDITLLAGGDIITTQNSEIDVHGGQQSFGGAIEMEAGNSIDIGSPIDNTAEDGGTINIYAGVNATVRDRLNTTGEGDAGSGGDIEVSAGQDVGIHGQIQSRGTGSASGLGGGDGGIVLISASAGNVTVADVVTVAGGTPDGGGGDIEILASGSIDIEPLGQIVSSGNGAESDGGELLFEAGLDVTIDGSIESEGGDSGGDIGIEAGRDMAINALVSAQSKNSASFGGSITIEAGASTSGNLTLTSTIDASAPGCDAFEFCSLGGDVDATACDITIESLGEIKVDALGIAGGNGGTIFLTARNQLTILGSLDATGAGGPLDGSSALIHPTGLPPIVTGSVLPAPTYDPRAMCTGGPTPFCLTPCPTCGDGVTEFPETCDDTTGTPASCDGCSVFCQLEDCDDGNLCTNDSCDPVTGCIHVSRPNGVSCDDGTICNGAESCLVGHCLPGQSLDCADANQCTLDSCDPVKGCQNDPLTGEPCDDGNECTTPDTCNASGACVPGDQLVCDDGNECTVDSCDPGSGCVFDPLSFVPCTDDGVQCTNDICFMGVCVHPKVPDDTSCSDSDLCDGEETCQNGSCTAGTPVTCSDDGNPCIDDVCDPATGECGVPNTASCDDGASCNGADTCNGAGVCVSEGDQCPVGRACDEITDTCVPTGDVTLIDLGTGECRPGGDVTLDLTLIPADGVSIGAIGADLAYDPEALTFVGVDPGEVTSARNGTCSANVESGVTLISCFTEDPDFVTAPYEEGVVAQVKLACKPVLPDEDIVIDNTPAALTATQIPAPVVPVDGADGLIGVLPCTVPGDTNLDCTVNIVELQTCIGMFLDLVPPDSCTDIDDNGDIGIVELQSCIAGFLRLLPCP